MISFLKSIFKRRTQQVLLLGKHGMACYVWIKGHLQPRVYLFQKDEAGYKQFIRYLQHAPNIITTIILDVADENYHEGYIPHVFGRDRKAVIKIHVARLFHNAKYFYADIQGREKHGRRDDNVLFTALREDESLTFWLSALTSLAVPLRAICSLPLASSQLLASLITPIPKHLLLVSLHSISGLRQSYFQNGKLKISRLINLPDYEVDKYVEIITTETTAIQLYLWNNSSISEDARPLVYILASGELKDRLLDKSSANSNSYNVLDISSLAQKHGFYAPIDNPFSDSFFVHLMQQKNIKNHYAADSEKKYFWRYKLQKSVFALSIFLIPITLAYSAFNIFNSSQIEQQNARLKEQINTSQKLYDQAQKQLPNMQVSPEELELIDHMANILAQRYKGDPFLMLNALGQTLTQFTDIVIREIKWSKQFAPDIESSPSKQSAAKNSEFKYYQVATIYAEINSQNKSVKAVEQKFTGFLSALKNMPSIYNVAIKKSPAGLDPDTMVQGKVQAGNLNTAFSVEIIMEIIDGSI